MNLKPAILVFALSALVAACDDSGTKAEAETGTSAATKTVESPAASSEASTDQSPSVIDTADRSASTTPANDKASTSAQLKSEMIDLRQRYANAQAESVSLQKTWDDKKAAMKDAEGKNDTAALETLKKEAEEARQKYRTSVGAWQQLRDQIKELNAKIVAAR